MRILIIGASGLVGSHCMQVLKEKGMQVVGTHLNFETAETVKFDPSTDDIETFLKGLNFLPQMIINCAALTNVDYCESSPDESFKSTVVSNGNVVSYCNKKDVRLVYISTDYVFDGKNGPYSENDATGPINTYGEHKLACERMVLGLKNSLILRITNVYGNEIRNKNFIARLIFDLKSNSEKTLKLPYDQFATPIYAGDIAKMIYLLIKDLKSGIYHLSSTDYYTRFHLAEKVKSYFSENNTVKFVPITTTNAGQLANRPLNGGLINIKFLKEYPYFKLTNVDAFILKELRNEL